MVESIRKEIRKLETMKMNVNAETAVYIDAKISGLERALIIVMKG